MNAPTWLDELAVLCERFSHLGATADIAAMSEMERWEYLQYLRRKSQTEECSRHE